MRPCFTASICRVTGSLRKNSSFFWWSSAGKRRRSMRAMMIQVGLALANVSHPTVGHSSLDATTLRTPRVCSMKSATPSRPAT
ncbi:hypothetical protein D3C76_1598330 [compost metagenome]